MFDDIIVPGESHQPSASDQTNFLALGLVQSEATSGTVIIMMCKLTLQTGYMGVQYSSYKIFTENILTIAKEDIMCNNFV